MAERGIAGAKALGFRIRRALTKSVVTTIEKNYNSILAHGHGDTGRYSDEYAKEVIQSMVYLIQDGVVDPFVCAEAVDWLVERSYGEAADSNSEDVDKEALDDPQWEDVHHGQAVIVNEELASKQEDLRHGPVIVNLEELAADVPLQGKEIYILSHGKIIAHVKELAADVEPEGDDRENLKRHGQIVEKAADAEPEGDENLMSHGQIVEKAAVAEREGEENLMHHGQVIESKEHESPTAAVPHHLQQVEPHSAPFAMAARDCVAN